MFSKFEHDPLYSIDVNVMLCAGLKERRALAVVLSHQTDISDVEDFIDELQTTLQAQSADIDMINTEVGYDIFVGKDADIFFDEHLSVMRREDVDRVMWHFHVLFIERIGYHTGVHAFDTYLSGKERTDIYTNIIVPWLKWVRSAR